MSVSNTDLPHTLLTNLIFLEQEKISSKKLIQAEALKKYVKIHS